MMEPYLGVHLTRGLKSLLENIIWPMQDTVLHHGCLRHIEEYDTIYENGIKVTHGTYITRFLTNFSPKNPQELFNLRHSSLRNAIERIFGVLKRRFKVLTHQLEYPFKIQVRLVKVMCCLHNIIRMVGGDDLFDKMWDEDTTRNTRESTRNYNNQSAGAVVRKAVTNREAKQAKRMRNEIADSMWLQYSKRQR